jgi:glycine cleavage system aminomethyltransferase T/glycine/D-amino acid oxidase-like deaminating enzyme
MDLSQRVVIIGAGIVGTNIADELALRGWSNITVVDQGPLDLPGGSTSHAPGLVFQINPSKTMCSFAKYTVEKLKVLQCFNPVGGLEVAETPERFQDLKRKHGYGASWGVSSRLLSPDECLDVCPLLNKDLIVGGLHIPSDGLALAAQAVQLLTARSRKAGVRFIDRTQVTGIDQHKGHVTGVLTKRGKIPADLVISAGGLWGVELGAMIGLTMPMLPVAHQYVKTMAVPALTGGSPANPSNLPILRHQDRDLYYRSHGDQIGIGYYGHRPMPVVAESLGETPSNVSEDNMPSRLQFTPQDFEPAWELSQKLLPALRNTKIATGFNGIMSFTPDGAPLIGMAPNLEGFFVAESVWVTHSAGVARAVAQLLTTGRSETDIAECDLSRFEKVQLSSSYIKETCQQSFVEVYDIIHPLQPRGSPRNLRISPFYTRQRELGAYFLESGGWERPQWYEANMALADQAPESLKVAPRDSWAARYTSPITALEAWRTRTAAAMYDLSSITRLEVSGLGASDLLQALTTCDIKRMKVTDTKFTLLLDEKGGIRSDIFVTRLAAEKFQLAVNGPIDLNYLQCESNRLNKQDSKSWTQVRDTTGETCFIGLWGPYSLDIIATVSKGDVSQKGFLGDKDEQMYVAGIPVTVTRLLLVGEPGWEMCTSSENGLRLWDALKEAGTKFGLIAGGHAALESLRLENGSRTWGRDMTSEHNPFEAGIQNAIAADKTSYVGYESIKKLSVEEPSRQLFSFTLNDSASVVLGKEPVFLNGEVAGYVTNAAFGYTVGKTIAHAYLPSSINDNDAIEIEYFGRKIRAAIWKESLLTTLKRGTAMGNSEGSKPAKSSIRARL